jgi:hypothetical protein
VTVPAGRGSLVGPRPRESRGRSSPGETLSRSGPLVGHDRTMEGAWQLACEAVEWADVEWPGWVRVRLVDADGLVWFLVDKVPVFGLDLGPGASLPVTVMLACAVVDEDGDCMLVVPLWNVEAEDGTVQFRVRRDQLEPVEG